MSGSPSRKARGRGEIKNDMRSVRLDCQFAASAQEQLQVEVKVSGPELVCPERQVCCMAPSASAPWRHGGLNE